MAILAPSHFRSHGRFYATAAIGLAAGVAAVPVDLPVALAVGGNVFFLVYLFLTWRFARRLTPDRLRDRAAQDDEGILVIVIITGAAIVLSLASIFMMLEQNSPPWWQLALAISTVPGGWFMLHTIMAFHYAHLYYAEADEPTPDSRDAGGLEFSGEEREPSIGDLLYHSFTIGMTAQVSDVDVTTSEMRRTVLVHSATSFFYNTVILALAVNVAVSRG